MTNYSNLLFFDKKGDPFSFDWNGSYWEGSILFDRISTNLFDVAHIFIIEKFLDLSPSPQIVYGFPHESVGSPSTALWETVWTQDPTDTADYSNSIYLYTLTTDPGLDSPVLVKQNTVSITPDVDLNEVFVNGVRQSSLINSASLQINIALNSAEEGVFERILELRNDPTGTNDLILRVTFYGETVGEDDRLKTILSNFGREFNKQDELLTRDSDLNEDLPNWVNINTKRKELILEGEQIYPYIGSFKGLVNAIKFFGYEDMRIKEYWLNMKHLEDLPALEQNAVYLKNNTISSRQTNLIRNILGSENAGKYTMVETYGKKNDGSYGIKIPKVAQDLNTSYKKTALFGLFYDINEATGDEDQFGYPVIRNTSLFSPEEVLIKLFGLKEKLKKTFLPINAKILDITGEGVFFSLHKKRYWTQNLSELKVSSGNYIDFEVTPTTGYIEDLRYFSTRPIQDGFLYPVVNSLQTQYSISPFGNTIVPYTNAQNYTPSEIQDLLPAIEEFYTEYQAGRIFKYLGDGDYTAGSTFRRTNGSEYYIPAGCPIVLQNKSFSITYNDLNFTYDSIYPNYRTNLFTAVSFSSLGVGINDSLNIPSIGSITIPTSVATQVVVNVGAGLTYLTPPSGRIAFIRVEYDNNNSFFGTIDPTSYNSGNGDLTINVRSFRGSGTYTGATVFIVNIFSNERTYELVDLSTVTIGYYSWDTLEYLDFQDIEWTITKSTPPFYNFSISGPIRDFSRLPHFLPYSGKYTVKCRIWDSFNSISTGYKTDVIEVLSREVNLLSLTRFREHESYGMDYIKKGMGEYDSNWIVPFENSENADSTQLVPYMPFYGNNYEEGQNYEILKEFPSIRATGSFGLSVTEFPVTSVVSPTGPSGGFLLARVTTQTPHGFSNGDVVSITDPSSRITGRFTISGSGLTGFNIPRIIPVSITGAGLSVRGPGGIELIADNTVIGRTSMTFDLGSTSSQLFVNTNNTPVLPRYNILSVLPSNTTGTNDIVLQAPFNTGANYNGKTITINATGSIQTTVASFTLAGGANPVSRYVPYSYSGEYPVYNARYLGTKRLSVDTFEDSELDSFYAHTYDMYDYHNDWLGGFDIYFPKYGDRIRVGKGTTGIAFGETDSPANGYLDLREACDQLNASNDRGISLFTYEVRNYSQLPLNFSNIGNTISPDLGTSEGPVNEEFSFATLPYSNILPSSIDRDLNGDIFITGFELYSFNGSTGGTGFTAYNSTNSLLPGSNTLSIHIDVDGNKWVGMENSSTPLVKMNRENFNTGIVWSYTDIKDNTGSSVITPNGSIRLIKTNSTNGDIFCYFDGGSASPGDDGLLYYSGAAKSWQLYTTANSNIPSTTIRDIVIEYLPKRKWKVWVCTASGLAEFNGFDFVTYNTSNSGLPNNDVYSLEIDILKNKWITTDDNIAYWDHERWTVWNPFTNPELPSGVFHNIVHTEHGNVWFVISPGSSPGTNILCYFNGYTFKFYNSRVPSSPSIPISPGTNTFHSPCLLYAKWKTLKNGVFEYPNNIWFITGNNEIAKLDYLVPHIHASAKYPGSLGWQFVYPDSSYPLPSLRVISDYRSGIGSYPQNFYLNASPSIVYSNISLNSDAFRPQMPHVDRYSWVKPTWQDYSVDVVKKQFPHINPDHLFLYTDLRSILDGTAQFEEYWKNSEIERYDPEKARRLFNNFEWVITMGDTSNDQGIKTTVDKDGYVYMTGFYQGTITLGEVNNVTPTVTLTSSSSGLDINTFLAKYNAAGVLQWARSIGPNNVSPALGANYFPNSLITDSQNNVYIVGYSEGIVSPVPSREGYLVKYTGQGDLINSFTTIISSPGETDVTDVKVDPSGNVYFTGVFNGTCTLGSFTITSLGSPNGFLAKLSSQGSFYWVQTFSSAASCRAYELAFTEAYNPVVVSTTEGDITIGNYTIPVNITTPNSALVFTSHNSVDGSVLHHAVLEGANSTFLSPSIAYKNGHAYIAGGFTGQASIQGFQIGALGASDIFFMKINLTGKVDIIKHAGGIAGDAASDIEIDSEENIYVLGYFAGELVASPNYYQSTSNSIDLILLKWDQNGEIIDAVVAGGILTDQGADLSLDKEDNLYVTGFYEGNTAEFPPYFVQSPNFGGRDIFLGKIPSNRFKPGKAYGEIISWLGSHSWSWNDKRLYDKNFEIPVNTTVFFNPIDSYIPGKKNHVWGVYNEDTGEKLIQVRGENSLIWTFVEVGNFSVELLMQDSNGNEINVYKKGLVRVINHKKPDPQDLVPEIVDSDDFRVRSILRA